MNVYVLGVHYSYSDGGHVVGIFSSPVKAKQAYADRKAKYPNTPPLADLEDTGRWNSDHYYIEQWEIDDTENV